jgi:hypothetical protein
MFLGDLEREGIPYFFIGHQARRNPVYGALRVWKITRENSINIYHSHLKYGIVFGALVKAARIHTHHNIVPKAGRFAYAVFNRLVDQYVGILRCLMVGRIQPQKNYPLMIDAIERLPDSVRDMLQVSIAGEGPADYVLSIKERVKSAGLDGVITFLGNRSDVPLLMGESHLFMMSSAWEGLPIALIEAAASGLACLVTDVGGCSEVVSACQNGVLVPEGNAGAFAAALASLVADPQRLELYSGNALRYSGEFSIARACDEHLSLYSAMVAVS